MFGWRIRYEVCAQRDNTYTPPFGYAYVFIGTTNALDSLHILI